MPTERYSLQVDVDTKGATRGVNTLAGSLARLAGPVGFGLLAKQVIDVGMKFQGLRTQLETVTGSAARATAAFEGIKDFASSTPFQVENVTKAFTNLSAKGFAPTEENLRSLGDMAAAFGTDITQATQAVTQAAFGEAESLKQYGIIMRQQGDSVKITYKGMTQEVKKDSAEIFAALTELAGVNFAGASVRQMKTLEGRLSTLKDTWANFLDSIAQAGVIDFATDAVEVLTKAVSFLEKTFKSAKPAAAELMAEMSGAFFKGLSVVNRAIAQFVASAVTGLQGAPWIVRMMLDPTGNSRTGGAAIAAGFAAAANEFEELGDRWGGIFRQMADDAREALSDTSQGFESLADVVSGPGGPSDALLELRRELELLRNEAAATKEWWADFWKQPENVDLPGQIDAPFTVTLDPFVEQVLRDATEAWEEIVRDHAEVVGTFANVGLTFVDQLAHGFDNIQGALQQMGQDLGGKFLGDQFAKLGETLGGKAGEVLGAMAPGIGAILGSVAGKLLGKLFGSGNNTIASALLGAGSGARTDTTTGVGELPRRSQDIMDPGGEGGIGGMPLGQLSEAFRQFNDWLDEIRVLTGAAITFTDQIKINLKKEGEVWVNILRNGQTISRQFSDINSAFEFALSELLKTAEISGQITPAIEEIMRSGMAFGDMMDAFNLVLGLGDLVGNSIDEAAARITDALAPFEQLRQDIMALGLSADATAPLLEQVAKAEARRNKELKTGLLSEMAAWAKELGVKIGLQRKVAILEAKVRAKELEVQLKMLGMWERWKGTVLELRNLSIEAARAIGTASARVAGLGGGGGDFGNLAKNIGREVGKAVQQGYERVTGSGTSPEERMVDAFRKIGMKDAFKSPFQQLQALARERKAEFDFYLRRQIISQERYDAAMATLTQEFTAAFNRLVDSMQEELGSLRNSLAEQFGRGTPLEQAQDSMSEFQRLLGLAMGGDLDALAAIQDAAQRAMDDAADAFGTSTTAFDDIFNMVMNGLQALQEADIEPPDPTEALNEQTTALVASLGTVQAAIEAGSSNQVAAINNVATQIYGLRQVLV